MNWRLMLVGRAAKLEKLGRGDCARSVDLQTRHGTELRDLSIPPTSSTTVHRGMSQGDTVRDISNFSPTAPRQPTRLLGRPAELVTDEELRGTAYAIIEGVDGGTHHVRFGDLEATSDARAGAIVVCAGLDNRAGARVGRRLKVAEAEMVGAPVDPSIMA